MKRFLPATALFLAMLAPAEDAAPPTKPEPAAEAAPADNQAPVTGEDDKKKVMERIKKLSEDEFELGEIRFNRKTREIRFPAQINLKQGEILEYAIVGETGKVHESLLRTKIKAFDLQIVLLLLRYQASAEHLFEGITDDEKKPQATGAAKQDKEEAKPDAIENRIVFHVETTDGKNRVRMEDWIFDKIEKKAAAKRFWVFTGSEILPGGLRADLEGSLVAIYLDAGAMFNNPGEGNNNDDRWITNGENMPPVDTEVSVVLSLYQPDAP
jgi:hypothetical protein